MSTTIYNTERSPFLSMEQKEIHNLVKSPWRKLYRKGGPALKN